MKLQLAALEEIEAKLEASSETQIALTDPDARCMTTQGLGTVSYNAHTAFDSKHHSIIKHELANIGSNCDQLSEKANKAHILIETESLTALTYRSNFKGRGKLFV